MATGNMQATEILAPHEADDVPVSSSPPAPGFRPHRITVDRYHQMIAANIFGENEPIFLWKGQLVDKMTKGHRHTNTHTALAEVLFPLVPAGWHLRQEQPAVLGDDSEPEPDFIFVRGRVRDYEGRIPSSQDVALVIEIADSSLSVDSGEVLRKYAEEKIPCYWLVNILDQRFEVYSQPKGSGYAEFRHYGVDDSLPVILDGREIGRVNVRDVLF